MKPASTAVTRQEMKAIQLSILRSVDELCQKHGLNYYLGGGTLLGAIRHQGYIPWDDDIDLVVPRDDYMRLLEIAQKELPQHFVVSSPYNTDTHAYPFSKIYDNRTVCYEKGGYKESGVYVDIFPLDGLPEDEATSHQHFKRAKLLNILLRCAISSQSIAGNKLVSLMKTLAHPFCKLVGTGRWLKMIDEHARSYDYGESEFVGVSVAAIYGDRERMEKSIFASAEKHLFEGEFYNIPCDHHRYLRNLYGDYMTLPPEEKRVSHHSGAFFWQK